MLQELKEQKRRIENLTLSVCFIGPAKSGKSTTINAILGVLIAPSDQLPCTVMPTVYRHKPDQINPVLRLQRIAVAAFSEGCYQRTYTQPLIFIQCNHP